MNMDRDAGRRGDADDDLAHALAALDAALRTRSGLSPESIPRERLRNELAASMRATGLGARDAGRAILADPAAFAALEAVFAPPETWLFRYPRSFDLVRRRAAEWTGDPIRAVVVGAGGWCEPCALAAALLAGSGGRCGVRLLAVDRNPAVFAAAPRFSGLALRGGIPEWARPYFRDEGDGLRPVREVSDAITVRVADARAFPGDAAPWRDSQVVAFRNVSIYLDHGVRTEVFKGLAQLLAPDGLLLVGHAETHAAREATGLEPERTEAAFALVRAAREGGGPCARSVDRRESSAGPMGSIPAPVERKHAPVREATHRATASTVDGDAGTRSDAAHAPRPAAVPTADTCLEEARAHQAAGDDALAARALVRALYLDPRHEEALVLAARLADARGDRAEGDRLRARALRVHLSREDPGPSAPNGA